MTSGRVAGDGSAGDADYGEIGRNYARFRRPDPRIAAVIHGFLGSARTVLNVGAGAGSYEPADRQLTAVEPSQAMRDQRPPSLAPAIDAVAEALPFADRAFDAAMAIFTVHQWLDLTAGLREMRRVTPGPLLIVTCDPGALDLWWLHHYAPEIVAAEARRYPPVSAFADVLGSVEVVSIPIPFDCTDGFNEAYYGRPEMLLDPEARLCCSSWSLVTPQVVSEFAERLARDLVTGEWDRRWGHLRRQATFEGPLRLLVASPAGRPRDAA